MHKKIKPLALLQECYLMMCRNNCGACCIALSISSPLPHMPEGKRAGERCSNLTDDFRCSVYDARPQVCRDFTASENWCGKSGEDALRIIGEIERLTGFCHGGTESTEGKDELK